MPLLQKIMRATRELTIEELDTLQEYIEWRRREILNAQTQPSDPSSIGIDAVCAAIKQTRNEMSKEEIREIKWTTSMLYLKESDQARVE